jgi:hypothetical protein
MFWNAATEGTPGATPAEVSATPAAPVVPQQSTPATGTTPANPALSTATGGGQGAGEAVAPQAPVVFDATTLKAPDGLDVASDEYKSFTELFSNDKLSAAERAQGLLDLYASANTKAAEANVAEATRVWETLNAGWRTELAAAPGFSGRVDEELGAIKQALIAQGAGDEFFAAMDLTGAGNHPAVQMVLQKLVAPHREGKAVVPGAQQSTPPAPGSRMFGKK